MNRPAHLVALCCLLFVVATGCGATPRAERTDHHVVVVSLDGFRHDYARRAETPTFDRFVAEGAHADRLLPPFPSQTFPSHAALATGVSAEAHGIVNNLFRDRDRGVYSHSDDASWYDAPPLWIHVQSAGLRSHVVHWIAGKGPWRGREAAVSIGYSPDVGDDAKIDDIIDWLGGPTPPRLTMVYLSGCDGPGHHHGPDSAEVTACVLRNDRLLGRLVDGLGRAPVAASLFVVSDHGMTTTEGELNAVPLLAPLGAEVISTGPIAHVYTPDAVTSDRAEVAARSLPHVAVHRAADLPSEWRYRHPTRTGELVLVADPGWRFQPKLDGTTGPRTGGGHHGHVATHPDMAGIFYAWGPGVRRGASLQRAHSVDLVPTICALLGIEPPAGAEGRILTEFIASRVP